MEGTVSHTAGPGTSQTSARGAPGPQAPSAHAQHRAFATQAHRGPAPGKEEGRRPQAGARCRARGSDGRAMEQRLAEFREARKRAGQAAEPSPSRQSAQTSGEKAEAAATPRAASGWLKRFLGWKPRPASAQTQPSVAQVRERKPRPETGPQRRSRGLSGNSRRGPAHHVTAF